MLKQKKLKSNDIKSKVYHDGKEEKMKNKPKINKKSNGEGMASRGEKKKCKGCGETFTYFKSHLKKKPDCKEVYSDGESKKIVEEKAPSKGKLTLEPEKSGHHSKKPKKAALDNSSNLIEVPKVVSNGNRNTVNLLEDLALTSDEEDSGFESLPSVHEEEKPFKCNNCDASYDGNGDLISHIASVHEKKKLFKCKHCALSFTEKGHYRKHMAAINAQRIETKKMKGLWK